MKTKLTLLLFFAISLSSCHRETDYTEYRYVLLSKFMHESWSGDEAFARLRSVATGKLSFERIGIENFVAQIGGTIVLRKQSGYHTEWF